MPHNNPPCTPPIFDHGRSHKVQDDDANKAWYSVSNGRIAGLYLDREEARAQIHGFHNGRWEKFATKAEALQYWAFWCTRLHTHDAVKYSVVGVDGEFDTYDGALAAAAAKYIVQV
ncbi:hypothetical protein DFH06DRAFT_1472989 [Mycena polygramma]|nr:hypothetical protein DFH06DRAFT_1475984 [Mycena polygramma]KAJ7657650.1 hypothetical protein DFH06DRAFT_1472989 [Mycena polygramma]